MPVLPDSAQTIQIGSIDREIYEVIELINSYSLPANFIQWLSNGIYKYKLLLEKIVQDKYTRFGQFHIEDELIFTGRVEFELNKLSKDMVQFLTSKKLPIDMTRPEMVHFKKEPVSKVTTEFHYTIISRFLKNEQPIGFSWEIYELPGIVKLYNSLQDPLRYWKQS